MKFSISLLASVIVLYLFHFLVGAKVFPHPDKVTYLLMGIALIGMNLSCACFFMNHGNLLAKKRKTYIPWMIVSAISFTLFMGYIGVCLVERAISVGAVFF